jgi:hypothetical protein
MLGFVTVDQATTWCDDISGKMMYLETHRSLIGLFREISTYK